ncbi:MAG: TMEM175 family protein [Chloroflexota bacterium]|nr:TMEM175 family protein [Chloroflexota bacterium]
MRTQNQRGPGAPLSTARTEAFSDGVFAVAITLLVLNLQVPQLALRESLNSALLLLWLKVLIYMLSFVVVGIYWVAHHNTFHYITHSDRNLLWLNILFLMCIVFIPFPTALLGQYTHQQSPVIIYAGTLVITGLVLQSLWWYVTSNYRLVDREIDPQFVKKVTRRNLLAPLIYLLAIGISFLKIEVSLALLVLVPVLYIFPGRIDRYWTRKHNSDETRVSTNGGATLAQKEASPPSRVSAEEK